MNDNKINVKKTNELGFSSKSVEKDLVNTREESYVIPFEAACSPEFAEGCIIMEDESD